MYFLFLSSLGCNPARALHLTCCWCRLMSLWPVGTISTPLVTDGQQVLTKILPSCQDHNTDLQMLFLSHHSGSCPFPFSLVHISNRLGSDLLDTRCILFVSFLVFVDALGMGATYLLDTLLVHILNMLFRSGRCQPNPLSSSPLCRASCSPVCFASPLYYDSCSEDSVISVRSS